MLTRLDLYALSMVGATDTQHTRPPRGPPRRVLHVDSHFSPRARAFAQRARAFDEQLELFSRTCELSASLRSVLPCAARAPGEHRSRGNGLIQGAREGGGGEGWRRGMWGEEAWRLRRPAAILGPQSPSPLATMGQDDGPAWSRRRVTIESP